MKKIKVLTLVGTRPEIIRLSATIQALDAFDGVDHVLVHTGQNYDYELNEIFFSDLNLRKPDHFLNAARNTAVETVGQTLIGIDQVFEREKPDAFLILGDTNSCLAAISAKKRQIPIFHMEAGNRCFDQRVPEESNRKIVDSISDINLTYSAIAREYLLREGHSPDRVIKTGSPMLEILNNHLAKIKASNVLENMQLKAGEYYLVSAHREENIESDRNFTQLFNALNTLAEKDNLPIIVSTHPRTRKRLDKSNLNLHDNIKLLKPLGFIDYNKLQMNAKVVISDSGTISEESAILNFPAITIREAHERPEAMEETSVVMTGVNEDRILQAISLVKDQPRGNERKFREVFDYQQPNVSHKMVRIILSYVDYVNRTVWGKLP